MKKLWQKNWQLNKLVEQFETADDVALDNSLVKADIFGSLAHAAGLKKIGLLTSAEFTKLKKGLHEILKKQNAGKFIVGPGDEDVHTKIENYLTKQYGVVGKKIHAGRSRNDQVLTALRLYTRNEALLVASAALSLAKAFLVFAKKYQAVPMPGYTHMQKAMPTTVGAWSAAFASGLLDSVEQLVAAFNLINRSPLGSGAGYGVPLPLPQAYTAKLMGFSGPQENANAVQNSRGKLEALLLASLVALLSDINKFATDILLFTTSEFNYFSVVPELCSGSSLMPQKKNVDVAELLRSKVHVVAGYYHMLVGIVNNLPLGYSRDLQDTKRPLLMALATTLESVQITELVVSKIKPNVDVLTKAMTPELFATERALSLVKKGVPFRDAYLEAAREVAAGTLPPATKKMLGAGTTGDCMPQILKRHSTVARQVNQITAHVSRAEKKLFTI